MSSKAGRPARNVGMLKRLCAFAVGVFAPTALLAQGASSTPFGPTAVVCGTEVVPQAQPPAGSGPVVYLIAPCWEAQGNQTLVEPATYLYYIKLQPSRP